MQRTKEILSIFSQKEPSADLLLAILSTNTSYIDKLQKIVYDKCIIVGFLDSATYILADLLLSCL